MTVRFKRANNPTQYVDVVIIAQGWGTSVKNIQMDQTAVYPNPMKNTSKVINPFLENGIISILDSNGKLILSDEFHSEYQLNSTALSSGLYSIILKDESGQIVSTRKISVL